MREGQPPTCGLTREALPLAGRCCPWPADQTTAAILTLGDEDIAPWLADGLRVSESVRHLPNRAADHVTYRLRWYFRHPMLVLLDPQLTVSP